MTLRTGAVARPRPWRIVSIAGELFWLAVMAMTIPVAVLAVALPLAAVVKLVLWLFGLD